MDNNQYKHLQMNEIGTLYLPHTSYVISIVCPWAWRLKKMCEVHTNSTVRLCVFWLHLYWKVKQLIHISLHDTMSKITLKNLKCSVVTPFPQEVFQILQA